MVSFGILLLIIIGEKYCHISHLSSNIFFYQYFHIDTACIFESISFESKLEKFPSQTRRANLREIWIIENFLGEDSRFSLQSIHSCTSKTINHPERPYSGACQSSLRNSFRNIRMKNVAVAYPNILLESNYRPFSSSGRSMIYRCNYTESNI